MNRREEQRRRRVVTEGGSASGGSSSGNSNLDTLCGPSDTEILRQRRTTAVPVRRDRSHTRPNHTADERVPFYAWNEPRACTFRPTRTHTHHIHITGLKNYSGQNGTSSIIRECDFSHGSTAKGHDASTSEPGERLASARTVLLVHTVRAGQS